MGRVAGIILCLGLLGCTHRPDAPTQSWRFEARPTTGEVRVMPVIGLHEDVAIDTTTWVGTGIPWVREAIRRERVDQIHDVPVALAMALPGAVNGELGRTWTGQFRRGNFPIGAKDRLRHALRGKADIDATLASVANQVGGNAALFSWVLELDGKPVTAEGFPGDLVQTEAGPVMVDHLEEPYRVSAKLGVALVTSDGEVVVRYTDTFHSVLSGGTGTDAVARDLAMGVAREVGKVWATDPRLRPGEPGELAWR